MKSIYFALVYLLVIASGCNKSKDLSNTNLEDLGENVIMLDEIEIKPIATVYNESERRINDLIHTRLEVSFDWENQFLFGEAILTLKPYFYKTDSLILDAKGFEIKKVELVLENKNRSLEYEYDGKFLKIQLSKEYTKNEEYSVLINYISKPNELEVGGSNAITFDKGLYFINPYGKEAGKPVQIWTQGETESSSCWFPTIDSPNERMTQELFITIDKKFKTLSNGELIYSNFNADDTRTDYWSMMLPHAPYLTMMAIGDYRVALDKWINSKGIEIPVNYYIEDEYSEHVFSIFGNTPEMMQFYSDLLGYEYPWAKYSQVIVRDYVSGAMENTTATIHGEFLNQTTREMLDGDNEDVISHELFHQWFGDLVTCESWANLPLNESFATYGEYLWNEHKYGLDEAALKFRQSRDGYFREATYEKKDMIRFGYADKDDMFDSHSYNKGGQILHMLRNYVGDEAFFASLSKYLHDNEYQSVEIHNLRLAFEEVIGEDFNWFFNQWFLSAGHPVLDISYNYDPVLKTETVTINQTQDLIDSPIFRLPLSIDIYVNDQVKRYEVVVDKKSETFTFSVDAEPQLVNVDAKKITLLEKTDNRPDSWWAYQYYQANNYLDKYEALQKAQDLVESNPEAFNKMIFDALSDPFWGIKNKAMTLVKYMKNYPRIEDKLIELTKDEKSSVRSLALFSLENSFDPKIYKSNFVEALNDQSYSVISYGLLGLVASDSDLALKKAKELENEKASSVSGAVARIYADYGGEEEHDFFKRNFAKTNPNYQLIGVYPNYLARQEENTINEGIQNLSKLAQTGSPWWIKLYAYRALSSLKEIMAIEKNQVKEIQSTSTDTGEKAELDHKIKYYKDLEDRIEVEYERVKKMEKDEKVLERL